MLRSTARSLHYIYLFFILLLLPHPLLLLFLFSMPFPLFLFVSILYFSTVLSGCFGQVPRRIQRPAVSSRAEKGVEPGGGQHVNEEYHAIVRRPRLIYDFFPSSSLFSFFFFFALLASLSRSRPPCDCDDTKHTAFIRVDDQRQIYIYIVKWVNVGVIDSSRL